MDAGTFTPAVTEDVSFTTEPKDATGVATTPTLNWALSPNLAGGTLNVSADTLTAVLVTPPTGNFGPVTLTVSTPEGVSDTATVTRQAGVTTAIGLKGQIVPKA